MNLFYKGRSSSTVVFVTWVFFRNPYEYILLNCAIRDIWDTLFTATVTQKTQIQALYLSCASMVYGQLHQRGTCGISAIMKTHDA